MHESRTPNAGVQGDPSNYGQKSYHFPLTSDPQAQTPFNFIVQLEHLEWCNMKVSVIN